jgi:hypothetical protein
LYCTDLITHYEEFRRWALNDLVRTVQKKFTIHLNDLQEHFVGNFKFSFGPIRAILRIKVSSINYVLDLSLKKLVTTDPLQYNTTIRLCKSDFAKCNGK